MLDYLNLFSILAFDNEPDPESEPDSEPNKTFTQDELNAILAKEKRQTKEMRDKLVAQLEEAKQVSAVGSKKRTDLEKQIEELQKQTMSVEERAKQKETRLQKKHEEELAEIKAETEKWQGLFTNSTISNELLKAASANKANDPSHILRMHKHDVRLVPILDEDGKPTNDYEARMDFIDINEEDGKEIKLDLTVSEAIKRMTELPQYGYLFEGNKAGGLNGNNVKNTHGKVDIVKIAKTNPALFRKMRRENPDLYRS